jgi:hypothetical protein
MNECDTSPIAQLDPIICRPKSWIFAPNFNILTYYNESCAMHSP